MEAAKNIAACFVTALAWLSALSVQDFIAWALATLLTIASIIYVIIGIKNRLAEGKIKQKQLEELNRETIRGA